MVLDFPKLNKRKVFVKSVNKYMKFPYMHNTGMFDLVNYEYKGWIITRPVYKQDSSPISTLPIT